MPPKADIALFDHLVGASKLRRRHGEAGRLPFINGVPAPKQELATGYLVPETLSGNKSDPLAVLLTRRGNGDKPAKRPLTRSHVHPAPRW